MSPLKLSRYDDPARFLEEVGPYLTAREAEHNLMLGLAGRLLVDPLMYGDKAYLAAVMDGSSDVIGAALRTPPHNLLFSEVKDIRAVDLIAADVVATYDHLPGVLGAAAVSVRFAEIWQQEKGHKATLERSQRVFRCAKLIPPRPTTGAMRRATQDDYDLLVQWSDEFLREAFTKPPIIGPETIVNQRLKEAGELSGFFFWEDNGQPVSFAGAGSPTPTGARIGPVYTPPNRRNRGYGSVLTASVTQHLLAHGREFVFLFTDLANPTSNKIYQAIGYEPVTDVDEYAFLPEA